MQPGPPQVRQGWTRRRATAWRLALASRIVLACADDASNGQIAAELRASRNTVGKCEPGFVADQLEDLSDPVGLENAIQLDDLCLSIAAWGGKAAM